MRRKSHQRTSASFVDTVESMAMVAGIPMPKVYIVEDPSPNAFATGISPEKGAVAVTRGLLNKLERYELEGVIAHEISHIRNYDIRLSTIAIALVAVIAILSDIAMRMIFWGSLTGGRNNRKSDNNNSGGHKRLSISLHSYLLFWRLLLQQLFNLRYLVIESI